MSYSYNHQIYQIQAPIYSDVFAPLPKISNFFSDQVLMSIAVTSSRPNRIQLCHPSSIKQIDRFYGLGFSFVGFFVLFSFFVLFC